MEAHELKPEVWYWVRHSDGSLAPFRFHKLCASRSGAPAMGEFFVGSMIQRFKLSQVVGEARMPSLD